MRNPKTFFLTYFTHPHTIAYQTHNHIQLYNTYAHTKRISFFAIKTRAFSIYIYCNERNYVTHTSLLVAWSHLIHFIISPRSAASRLRGLTTTATPSNKACCYAGAIRITRVRKIWFLRFVMSVTRVTIVTIVSHIVRRDDRWIAGIEIINMKRFDSHKHVCEYTLHIGYSGNFYFMSSVFYNNKYGSKRYHRERYRSSVTTHNFHAMNARYGRYHGNVQAAKREAAERDPSSRYV